MPRDPKPDRETPPPQPDDAARDERSFDIDPDQTAAMIDELAAERDRLAEENKRLLLAAAELQNQVRTLRETGPKDVAEARRQTLAGVARDLIQAIDTFDLALGHDPSTVSAASILQGVTAIREGLLRNLSQHGITAFAPQPNDHFEPGKHEAVTMMPAPGVEPGRVAASFQVGYALHDRILRPAKVAVAPT